MPKPPPPKPLRPQPTKQTRNKANTRRNTAQIEDYLISVEKAHGFEKAWRYRELLEQGNITLEELRRF